MVGGPGSWFDFDAAVTAPFRMQPGLRRLADGRPHLTPLTPGSRHQREKLAVLTAWPSMALQCAPGFDAAPTLRALAAHAAAEHPDAWSWDGVRAHARRLGAAVDLAPSGDGTATQLGGGPFGLGDEVVRCLRGLPPAWRLAGLIALAFAEDLAVVDAADGTIPWLAVALPSHWAPEDKLGLPFAAVHAPVADNALILRAAESLVRLAAGPDRWERFVWNVTGHARLHAHPAHVDAHRWPADIAMALPAGAWWRTERQTFVPLTTLRQAVFTITVDVQPLAAAITTPDHARRLHDALASMSPEVLRYRGLTDVQAPLLVWLHGVAAGGERRP